MDGKEPKVGAAPPPAAASSAKVGADSDAPADHVVDLVDDAVKAPLNIPFLLEFTDLTYAVKPGGRFPFLPPLGPRGREKTLLDSVSGAAREGEILAVLGASGFGKSTLIDALANRIAKESLRGSVTLNGEQIDGRLFKVISAYVMQDDLLYPMLTVRETLTYAAEFRLPRSMPRARKESRVQALIDQLGLRRAADTIIGDEGHRGVSGGERRRVSIGIDIVHDPMVLFLDEPTSGLDSSSALMVVQVLQRIARSGSIVAMSIHQPSCRILSLLDRILFLSRGRGVYYGPVDGLYPFFSEFGSPVPENENPVEFALDLIHELERSADPAGRNALIEFNESWQELERSKSTSPATSALQMPLKDAIRASISQGKLVSGSSTTSGSDTSASPVQTYANPFWVEMAVLTRRGFTNTRRMPELLAIRVGTVMVTGFILATLFWRLDDSPKGVQERLGFFAMGMSTMFYTCSDALPVFLQERYIYMRETAYNAYRRVSYVVSNAIVGFPSLVILAIALALTTFFAIGLSGGFPAFLYFVLMILASFWAGSGFVTFLSGIVKQVILGYTIVVAILAYFLLFSGYFINRDRIPHYWIWFHYLSLIKYAYEGVLQNEFGGSSGAAKCFVRGVQMFDGTPVGEMPYSAKLKVLSVMSETLGRNLTDATCITNGPEVLRQQAVTDLSKWDCLWITLAWGFLFRILFYIALQLGSRNKRK
ncbi:ABC transporter G family member 16 [Ananas comosus]|uniref:ABC transporter G family member 5 n=1 Tax=Ananas comosus TaxID=4615 RepID=A0A199W6R5_ANACO|nr:ABC transporter G family member 16 [Ananas comosus]